MVSSATLPSTRRHLGIFNPKPEPCGTFPQFSRFPAEIRWLVWEQELSHERMIDIELRPVKHAECEEKTKHLRNYDIILNYRWKTSKLFRTTSESRCVALAFYRVQLPCLYRRRRQGPEVNTTLYICPELDTLMLNRLKVFEYLARDLWARDPHRVGLINLALQVSPLLHSDYRAPGTQGHDTSLLEEGLLRIKRLTIMWISSCPNYTSWGSAKVFIEDRTVPILGGVPGFHRLPCDHRLNDQDLKQVYTRAMDARVSFDRWLEFLALLGVQHSHKVDYRFGICRGASGSGLISRRDHALLWTGREVEQFRSWPKISRDSSTPTDPKAEEVETLLQDSPQPVIGFWLFRMESHGPPLDTNEISSPSPDLILRGRTLDMSKHKPELCLANIY